MMVVSVKQLNLVEARWKKMKKEFFLLRLEAGKACHFKYNLKGIAGLINVWKHNDSFILTWEECENGDQ